MRAVSELFESTNLVVPCVAATPGSGEIPITGRKLAVVPISGLTGSGLRRKLALPTWAIRNGRTILREVRRADAVHAPIPGDVGTLGMLLALLFRKPLLVRHCGNWFVQRTAAERFWKWAMERYAGGRNVMLATGGADRAPSRNEAVRWIFATSLTDAELRSLSVPRTGSLREQVRLAIACRQEVEKGTGIVIESLPRIVGHYPKAELHVIGDGPALPAFKARAAALGVSDRVIFHGKVDHARVVELLKGADIFCYPTRASEGFPKVVLEALACGLPVVTTGVSVLPALVGRGCGVLLDRATPDALADAVLGCLSDSERYRGMSVRALATASEFSLERWRDQIGSLVRQAWGPLREDG
jgi:glycosyltransferase involved in cell wall biosynthesis